MTPTFIDGSEWPEAFLPVAGSPSLPGLHPTGATLAPLHEPRYPAMSSRGLGGFRARSPSEGKASMVALWRTWRTKGRRDEGRAHGTLSCSLG